LFGVLKRRQRYELPFGDEKATVKFLMIMFFESFLKCETRSCPEKSTQSDESRCSIRLMVSKKSGMLEDRLDKVLRNWEKKGQKRVRGKGTKRHTGPVLQWLRESGRCGSIFPRKIKNLKMA
jgi:hypothetical protein